MFSKLDIIRRTYWVLHNQVMQSFSKEVPLESLRWFPLKQKNGDFSVCAPPPTQLSGCILFAPPPQTHISYFYTIIYNVMARSLCSVTRSCITYWGAKNGKDSRIVCRKKFYKNILQVHKPNSCPVKLVIIWYMATIRGVVSLARPFWNQTNFLKSMMNKNARKSFK